MVAVDEIVERLLEISRTAASEAGAILLDALSHGRLTSREFLEDPLSLTAAPYCASRYLAQITLRALRNDYDSVVDIIASLQALNDRHVPLLEPNPKSTAGRIAIAEAKVLDLRQPRKNAEGNWESAIDALVTSGPARGVEIQLRLASTDSPTACLLVPYLWVHATIAIYNVVPIDPGVYGGCPETFIVVEPMRQVNATSIARSLHCVKPQLDQMRRGKGDITVHTLKGILVHAAFDRLLEGESALDALYEEAFQRAVVPLASISDEFFDEDAFRDEALQHMATLQAFVDANPRLREHAQLELKRYSATMGIQGRIDAVFQKGNSLDILELKTGAKIRPEDHAQLFIYRLLMSDLARRRRRTGNEPMEITASLLSSRDGYSVPLHIQTDFFQVIDARNKLLAAHYALGLETPHFRFRYEGFREDVCGACVSWTRKRCKEASALYGDRPESIEAPDLEYFRRFTGLVERERWSAERDSLDLLDDSRTGGRVKDFRTIVGARIAPDAGLFTFDFEENTSDIANGDAVLIHSGNISSTTTFHGYVRDVEPRRLRITIRLKRLQPAAFAGQDWIIDRLPLDVSSEASHSALHDFLVRPMDAKKRAVLGIAEDVEPAPALAETGGSGLSELNSSQIQAIERAATCADYHLIWGPPGTGKTRVIPQIVARIDGPVLLGAFTNTAVDKMLLAVLDHDPATPFLRIGRSADSPELAARIAREGGEPSDYFSDDLAARRPSVKAVRAALQSARIVAATAHRACVLPYLRQRRFEIAIVDEAGQLTEPLTLGLILRGRRFVLIGDDRQLPPVVRTRGLALSLFERLKGEAEQRRDSRLTLLDTQYRMHPEIMAVTNTLFYDGRLKAGVAAGDRVPPEGNPVELLGVENAAAAGDDRNARRNLAEAEAIRDLVGRYIHEMDVTPASIGVVSPFRSQVALLRKLLEDTGVTVDTVERFQGGERDVMILSFVRPHGTGFVFDERRFNVAITRARRKLVLVAHPNLFRNSRYEWLSTFMEPNTRSLAV